MNKLAISKISDRTIRIEDIINRTRTVYTAVFKAKGNEITGIVKICDTHEKTVYSAHFSGITVDGVQYTSVRDTVQSLNDFIGNH